MIYLTIPRRRDREQKLRGSSLLGTHSHTELSVNLIVLLLNLHFPSQCSIMFVLMILGVGVRDKYATKYTITPRDQIYVPRRSPVVH